MMGFILGIIFCFVVLWKWKSITNFFGKLKRTKKV